jgi:hypothetical protein
MSTTLKNHPQQLINVTDYPDPNVTRAICLGGNDFVWPSKCYVKLSFITNGAFYLAMKYKIINFAAE